MNKKIFCLVITIFCVFFLTGCSSKVCSEWEYYPDVNYEDCSRIDGDIQKRTCKVKMVNKSAGKYVCTKWIDINEE